LFFHGDDLFLNANEAAQGNTDLNGDGDASDLVVLKASLSTKAISNPGIPAGFVSPSDGDFSLLAVDEADAHADLNGDADTSDQVYALQNWSTGTRTNLGLAAAQTGSPVVVGPGWATFSVGEAEQGQTDLNGDGDTDDPVIFVVDFTSGAVTNLHLESDIS